MSPSLRSELPTILSALFVPSLLGASLLAPVEPASGAVAVATVQVDGSAATELWIPSGIGPTGAMAFAGATSLEGVDVAWNYAADLEPSGNALVNGAMVFINTSTKTLHIRSSIAAPLCPAIIASGKIGGFAKVTLTANADGGQVTCHSDGKEVSASASDGTITWPLFSCPFNLSLTGAGNASTSMLFGSPFPSAPGPSAISDIGQSVDFTLTPGDKASLSMLYVVGGTFVALPPVACPGDINGDGVVDGGDLPVVLASMGLLASCGDPADVNADGLVDGADLAAVLTNWGPCPEAPAGG